MFLFVLLPTHEVCQQHSAQLPQLYVFHGNGRIVRKCCSLEFGATSAFSRQRTDPSFFVSSPFYCSQPSSFPANYQSYRIYTVALANEAEAFSLTEAYDGVDTEDAVLSIIGDGVPHLYVETVADGQAAWTYDIFFAGPQLANVPELVVVDEGTGKNIYDTSLWRKCGFVLCTFQTYSCIRT